MQNTAMLKTRIWGTLAHIPIITIIWMVYIAYTYDWRLMPNGMSFDMLSKQFSTVPIRPIVMTVLSLPISLSIMFLKKSSSYIRMNAEQAFQFNMWLIKRYILSAIVIVLGMYFTLKIATIAIELFILAISLNCVVQSLCGIATAARGLVYHYWYPPIL